MTVAATPQTHWLPLGTVSCYEYQCVSQWPSPCERVILKSVRHAHTQKTYTPNADTEAKESNLTLGWAEIGQHSQSLSGQAGTLHDPAPVCVCVCGLCMCVCVCDDSFKTRKPESKEWTREKSCSWRSRVVRLVERRDCLRFRVSQRFAGCQLPLGLLHDIH